ncbi:GNAT family N-acetyltransferase [Anaerovorax odorimutans]|uniref:GNAT family N-acetyltransferase n=1 Tax=Anaerovorax odorimutans TaxID=109327 RepID=UPI00040D768E|nr:GNAT family N-acetyltransferase [Anaerovorax odorimutans]
MIIKNIEKDKVCDALLLIEKTFMEYEASEYSKEGISTFKEFLYDENSIKDLEFFGAYIESKLVGVIATRNNGSHITLFFVDGKYHKRGIGKALFKQALKNGKTNTITVNSSTYAVDIYRHLGFIPDSDEQIKDGIRYTPMTYTK